MVSHLDGSCATCCCCCCCCVAFVKADVWLSVCWVRRASRDLENFVEVSMSSFVLWFKKKTLTWSVLLTKDWWHITSRELLYQLMSVKGIRGALWRHWNFIMVGIVVFFRRFKSFHEVLVLKCSLEFFLYEQQTKNKY